MTEIKIFVVRTEINKDISLNANMPLFKIGIAQLFGGLTVIPNCLGLWVDPKGQICKDETEIWITYKNGELTDLEREKLRSINLDLKAWTRQISQLYTINGDPYFV